MKEYTFVITITCETEEQAHQVVAERLGPEEDYGFPYTIEMPVMLGDLTEEKPIQNTRYQVRFRPQAWINNQAVDVDKEGPNVWFFEEDSVGPVNWAAEAGRDLDFLLFDPFAPQWIKDWSGPFEIELIID